MAAGRTVYDQSATYRVTRIPFTARPARVSEVCPTWGTGSAGSAPADDRDACCICCRPRGQYATHRASRSRAGCKLPACGRGRRSDRSGDFRGHPFDARRGSPSRDWVGDYVFASRRRPRMPKTVCGSLKGGEWREPRLRQPPLGSRRFAIPARGRAVPRQPRHRHSAFGKIRLSHAR